MPIKSFSELLSLDITPYISKKPVFKYNKATGKTEPTGQKLDYLSWPDVLALLYQNGAESVKYNNLYSMDGHSLFTSAGALPEVHVWVEIDGNRYESTYPVIEGTKDISMEKIVQSDIHNASQRAFVKCVAINTGLGLSLWQKEDRQRLEQPPSFKDNPELHSLFTIKSRVESLMTEKLKKGLSAAEIAKSLGMKEKQMPEFMEWYGRLYTFEERLKKL